MFEDQHLESAYQSILENRRMFKTKGDMQSFLLGVKRQNALTEDELKLVVYQAVRTVVDDIKAEAQARIAQSNEGIFAKAEATVILEASTLPTEMRLGRRK